MDGGVTSCRSILEKPLSQLTEEDISQLTREDCRKFLKEKGMRRPSWNKSQAIQQVISLKALLEKSDDSGTGALRKVCVSAPENAPRATSNSADSAKEPSVPLAGDEDSPYRRKDPPKCTIDTDNKPIASRDQGEADSGQMTIFYCGKVNVYDGVPPDKVIKLFFPWIFGVKNDKNVWTSDMHPNMDLQARAIMHLAATPIDNPQDSPFSGVTAFRPIPCHLQVASDRHGIPPSMISQTMQTDKMADYPQEYREKGYITRDADVEGQANRKVSLQRYREKRKDRGRFLKGKKVSGPSGLEMYLNHQVRTQGNGEPRQTGAILPGLPHSLSSPVGNKTKIASLSTDFNDKEHAARDAL